MVSFLRSRKFFPNNAKHLPFLYKLEIARRFLSREQTDYLHKLRDAMGKHDMKYKLN